MAKSTIEVGDNYCVELDGEIASCRVWSRPDLDSETGARLAAKKVTICRSLAQGPALGMLFDLREAPKVTGPKTQHSISQILAAWETAARPIAVVVSPASLQKLQLARLAGDAAPKHGCVFVELELALQWLRMRVPRRSVPPARAASSQPGALLPAAMRPAALPPAALPPAALGSSAQRPATNPRGIPQPPIPAVNTGVHSKAGSEAERSGSLRAGAATKKLI